MLADRVEMFLLMMSDIAVPMMEKAPPELEVAMEMYCLEALGALVPGAALVLPQPDSMAAARATVIARPKNLWVCFLM
ncbi:hypothetical protein SDC9_89684 [bioreactor metagenome]|uniref:Uncharacterized protein n=1 Tax=bioreactor metagenome TaxID=1076179 RepID=A0A644ZQ80_9ZZZZ